MTTYIAYRNGSDELERRVKMALATFYKQHSRWPTAVVVHPSEVAEATALVSGLGVGCQVRGNGGCLKPEVWLEIGADTGHPKEKANGHECQKQALERVG